MNLKTHLLTALLALSAAALPLAAQQVQVKPDIRYTTQPQRYELGGLVVDGIKGYDDELLRSIANLEVGQSYQVPGPDLTQAVKNYWKQGLFSNVQLSADSIVGNRIYLRVSLTAQPRIASLNLLGLKKSEREEIEAQIPLRAGNQITPNLVDRTRHRIAKYFEDKGYKNAQIHITQREDLTADNRVLVDIRVDKQAKIRVHRIYLEGVAQEHVTALKNAMKKTTDRSTFKKKITFASRKFLPEKYEEDKQLLIEKLNTWGYRDALIERDSVVAINDKEVDIYLRIHEGKPYYLRQISWVGNTVFPTSALEATLQMKRGDLYNQSLLQKRLNGDDDAVGRQYYNNGYVFSNVSPVEVRVEGDSVDLEVRVSENRQAVFNRINISGNDRLYDHVIRREIQTKPGDLFSLESIQRSVRDLAATNQFDTEILQREIFNNIRPNEQTGTVDLTYPLVTKGSDQVELSAGWSQSGIIGRTSLKFTNFSIQDLFGRKGYKRAGFIPQGDGQTLQLSAQSNGRYQHNFSISFIDPWFGGKRPNSLSVTAFFSHSSDVSSSFYNSSNYLNSYLYGYGSNSSYYNYASYYDPDKYLNLYGLTIGFGKRLRWPDDYFNFSAAVGYTRYSLKNWRYFLFSNGQANNINFSLTLSRSSTDSPFFPRRGSDFSLSVNFTPPYSLFDGRNYAKLATNSTSPTYQREVQEKYRWIEYHKWSFKFRNYLAFNNKFKYVPVLMSRAEVGILGAYNKYRKSPFETYYVGGDGMTGGSYGYATETIGLRGYENGSLAGASGDNAYAYTRLSMELRFPLMLETATSIYAHAFVEAGNAWQHVNRFNPFNLRKSAGVGVRILLPMVGLLGIDWAYGFDKYNDLNRKIGGSQFHFVLGQEF